MPDRIIIADWSQVPTFATEEEEYAFWDTHEPADGLISSSPPDPEEQARRAAERVAAKSRTISIRVEEEMVERLKAMAAQKGVPYQTLLKRFVVERLYEEERRAGVFGTTVVG